MDAVILCGGQGTRLASIVTEMPKSLAPVCGRPFLDHLLDYVTRSNTISRLVLATGYLAQQIQSRYGAQFNAIPIVYSCEPFPLGTGGALIKAIRDVRILEPFFILNGDSFVDADLSALANSARQQAADLCLTLFRVADASRFGTVSLLKAQVTSFMEKRGQHEPGLINAGIYVATPTAFARWVNTNGIISFEQTIIPALITMQKVVAIESGTRFIDIGLPETYAQAALFFEAAPGE
jgi:D-glycero-alpha-D-manno-heptose 1-phosphate guanylyltransferase